LRAAELGRFGLPDTTQDPNLTLTLVLRVLGAVPVNRAISEPKVHLPLTITFAGRRPPGARKVSAECLIMNCEYIA